MTNKRAIRNNRVAMDRHQRIVLSGRDTVRVLKLLKNPPKPTRALIAAARRAKP